MNSKFDIQPIQNLRIIFDNGIFIRKTKIIVTSDKTGSNTNLTKFTRSHLYSWSVTVKPQTLKSIPQRFHEKNRSLFSLLTN